MIPESNSYPSAEFMKFKNFYTLLTVCLINFLLMGCTGPRIKAKPEVKLEPSRIQKKPDMSLQGEYPVEIYRDNHGVPHINARSEKDFYYALGYLHARDRGMQLLVTRILCNGQAGKYLASTDDILEIDKFFRRMNWRGDAAVEISKVPSDALGLANAYVDGLNGGLKEGIPWELKLLKYNPEPWILEDSVALLRLMGYVSLAETQATVERLLVEMVQAGVSRPKLDALFPGLLARLDTELLKKIKLGSRIIPEGLAWNSLIPKLMASNNWVVSGKRTKSGKAIMANDPHMEVNRLPCVWQEICATIKNNSRNRYIMGATVPGIPGFVTGRTNDLAWGLTYSYADAVDSWVEECRGDKYRREDQWLPLRVRQEVIERKGKPDVKVVFYENDHGTLDYTAIDNGYFLSTKWAAGQESSAKSLVAMQKILYAESVQEGMDIFGQLEISENWLIADAKGEIGYQMSGLVPVRQKNGRGLVPLAGWDKENDWRGFIPSHELPRIFDPEKGFIVTANNNLNHLGKTKPINMPMGPYRADRISQLLKERIDLTREDMISIQYDVYSIQAEKFMEILRPLLPDTKQGRILRDWDLNYTHDAKGAYLFEQFYWKLIEKVFGDIGGLGQGTVSHLITETGIFIDFYENFDRILLSDESVWFEGEKRDAIYKDVAREALDIPVFSWGKKNTIIMQHLLFGGKFPRLFGFDVGPIPVRGGRATPHQGQIYRSADRTTSFIPSYRFIVDFASDGALTNLPGGPSDRRFSKWYNSDIDNWLNGGFRILTP
jgi:penicillin amidase